MLRRSRSGDAVVHAEVNGAEEEATAVLQGDLPPPEKGVERGGLRFVEADELLRAEGGSRWGRSASGPRAVPWAEAALEAPCRHRVVS